MSLQNLPDNLPVPQNDGACDHLTGLRLPRVTLPATDGTHLDLAELTGRVVLYVYPMTGTPGQNLPDGWNATPGARGCTPQSCAFRDHQRELDALGTQVFGISTQTTAEQRGAAERLHLPYLLLSDAEFSLAEALVLPTFRLNGKTYLKRVTLIVRGGVIEKVFYPAFPPDQNAAEVVAYLNAHPTAE